MNTNDKKALCPVCKTGKESLELDPKSLFCPFIDLHDGKSCRNFVKIKEDEKN